MRDHNFSGKSNAEEKKSNSKPRLTVSYYYSTTNALKRSREISSSAK